MNGVSERLLVSHYVNNYGGALRRLNAIRARLLASALARDFGSVRAWRAESGWVQSAAVPMDLSTYEELPNIKQQSREKESAPK